MSSTPDPGLTFPQRGVAEIDATWDPYKLYVMIKRSQHDLAALRRRFLDVERSIYDADRVNDNAERRETGVYPESWARPAATAVDPGAGSRRSTVAAERTVPDEYELSRLWDVYKLREVFSDVQRNVDSA
ncbi:hypothetical protein CSHISOI_04171 [Colletotrichum shisoi]|uniref:Uncharacterized protein n=1 Tax=Colletotrichum shisoi TaxID=2078593 RepID=A0A5Q4BW39_9PEZI|nr:hypothetical protein CSHISOI_04171 [Colletotrichum shisoi]